MKSFWKYTLATIVGSIITLLLVFLLMLGVFSSILSNVGESEVVVENNTILKINLSETIPDRTSDSPLDYLSLPSFSSKKYIGLNDIMKTIEKAKTDDRIKGIYLDLNSIDGGMASIEEIRNKLLEFKETGKFIISYSSSYSQTAYYLATVSDKIYINPQGDLVWKGMSSRVMFYKGMLEKLGIEAQIFRHGQFKSAVEPYMNTQMSEASKLQSVTLIGSIWDDICQKISKARNISVSELNSIANGLLINDAASALQYKMIDGIMYYDEVLTELKSLSGSGKDNNMFISLSQYNKVKSNKIVKNEAKEKIAVIFAEGDIIDGAKESRSIGGDWMSEMIRKVRKDKDVKAVVLRVNSPGGSALASEIMWREIDLTNKEKPVVVSMGNYAASGGYYISCPARYIFAQPNTITGSIGVFGMMPNIQSFMNDKLGITVDGVKTNDYADMGELTRPVNSGEREYIQKGVEDFYKVFITRVADGRKMTTEQVDEIGQGRVWSGLNALEIGLIDEIGGLNDAVMKAVELAGLNNYVIHEYPEKSDFVSQFMKEITENASINIVKETLGENYKYYKTIETVKNLTGIQARIEYELEIY
jgi:protease-4